MSQQSRRSFLGVLAGLGTAAIGALLAVPGVSYLADPLRKVSGKAGRWIAVADMASLNRAEPVSAPVVGEQTDAWTTAPAVRLGTVWLRVISDNEVKAWNAECPHLGCKVGFDRNHAKFGCPCHDSAFSLEGEVLGGPAPRGMDPLETRIQDGKVEVRFIRFRAQARERIEVG